MSDIESFLKGCWKERLDVQGMITIPGIPFRMGATYREFDNENKGLPRIWRLVRNFSVKLEPGCFLQWFDKDQYIVTYQATLDLCEFAGTNDTGKWIEPHHYFWMLEYGRTDHNYRVEGRATEAQR